MFCSESGQKNRVPRIFSHNSNIGLFSSRMVFPVLCEHLLLGSSKEKLLSAPQKISTLKSGNRQYDQNGHFSSRQLTSLGG